MFVCRYASFALLLGLLFVAGFSGSSLAAGEFNLSKDVIQVTTGFHGDHIQVYGTKKPDQDIVIVVRGPGKDMKVRRKEKVWGGWINRSYMIFKEVPAFYRAAATAPLSGLVTDADMTEFEIGLDHLGIRNATDSDAQEHDVYRDALIRNKATDMLMSSDVIPVEVLDDRLFRASFYLPHNVSLGTYDVSVYHLADKVIAAHETRTLTVEQVGFNAFVIAFSHQYPLLYGLICVFLAIFAGWLSNRFKRNL